MRASTRSNVALATVLVVLALAPRAFSLDRALTIDERLWIDRSDRFVSNVAHARFGQAYETGHPGVTIMWIGGIAQRTLPAGAPLRARYARARFALAIADAALILLVALLLASLYGSLAGFAGGALLALDPFLLAHNRVLHLDGLLSLLMLASFLALLYALRRSSRGWLVASGALAGLAALTKQPSVFLLPATALVLWRDGRGIVRRLLTWAGAAAAVAFVLYPALWTNPAGPLGLILGSAARGASDSHSVGFFLGRADAEPGPLFYPVVLIFRTSIVTLPAAIVTAVWAVRNRRRDAKDVAVWLLFALGFMAMMTIGFKKGDRYLLPSVVAVDIAIAIAAARALRNKSRALVAAAITAALALHGLPALVIHPYEEAHYNWLAGGPVTAEHALVIGWGEGLDEAATALARLPGANALTVATTRVTQFEDFFPGRTVRLEDSAEMRSGGAEPDLVLFYISSVQSGRFDTVWRRYRNDTPVYELDVNGLPFVRVYRAHVSRG
jgi:hypothetical protein